MWLGSQQLLSKLDIGDVSVLSSRFPVQETARDFGVFIDSRLTLSDHVAAVFRSGYYQLRQLRPAVRCSSDDATKSLVQAFVASRLDYCNALFYGIIDELIRSSQFRTLLPGWLRAPGGLTISRLCSASCTGFQCGSASCSRSRRLPTSPCPAICSGLPGRRLSTRHRRTCQTTAFC